MTRFDSGDIVLVRFPFTDLSSSKQRPALVLSPGLFSTTYGDVVVLALTSRAPATAGTPLRQWQSSGLLKPTWFKPLVATISSTAMVKKLGALDAEDFVGVREVLGQMIAAPWFIKD